MVRLVEVMPIRVHPLGNLARVTVVVVDQAVLETVLVVGGLVARVVKDSSNTHILHQAHQVVLHPFS